MARSIITNTTDDLISDSGAVLWSFVTGEQLEFPVILSFINDTTLKASNNYIYEAVVIEANNTTDQSNKPSEIKLNGVQTNLVVRAPELIGVWEITTAYSRDDVVYHDNKYYRLLSGENRIYDITPDLDMDWEETVINKIYLQFPKTLGSTWTQKATVTTPVYGFFELRVTEPESVYFVKTWKPVRGMVQLLFSPTNEVPDV
jgi:hypothetical protein